MRRVTSRSGLGIITAGVIAATAVVSMGTAHAQEGTIRGQVVDQNTLRPLAAVQVHIPSLNLGTLTNAQGSYLLVGVPAGQVAVEATLVGYGRESGSVQVSAGATAQLDFRLESRAINLDEVVVTGTGAPARRRQLGQTINSITTQEIERRSGCDLEAVHV